MTAALITETIVRKSQFNMNYYAFLWSMVDEKYLSQGKQAEVNLWKVPSRYAISRQSFYNKTFWLFSTYFQGDISENMASQKVWRKFSDFGDTTRYIYQILYHLLICSQFKTVYIRQVLYSIPYQIVNHQVNIVSFTH